MCLDQFLSARKFNVEAIVGLVNADRGQLNIF